MAELFPGKTCRKEPPASSKLRHEARPHLSACGDIHTWWVKSLFILSYYGLLIQNRLNKIFCSVCKSSPHPEFVLQEEQEPRQWLSLRATSLCLKGPPCRWSATIRIPRVLCSSSMSSTPESASSYSWNRPQKRASRVSPLSSIGLRHPFIWKKPSAQEEDSAVYYCALDNTVPVFTREAARKPLTESISMFPIWPPWGIVSLETDTEFTSQVQSCHQLSTSYWSFLKGNSH